MYTVRILPFLKLKKYKINIQSSFSKYSDIIMKVIWESKGFSHDMWLIVMYFKKNIHAHKGILVLIACVILVLIHFEYLVTRYENEEPNIDVKLDMIHKLTRKKNMY